MDLNVDEPVCTILRNPYLNKYNMCPKMDLFLFSIFIFFLYGIKLFFLKSYADSMFYCYVYYRKGLHIFECLLFETDDLIMRKNEKHVILCLLEVARRGAKFGKYVVLKKTFE